MEELFQTYDTPLILDFSYFEDRKNLYFELEQPLNMESMKLNLLNV
jgi:hypothetical protein